MNNINPIPQKETCEFLIEWISDDLTELRLIVDNCQSLIREESGMDDLAEFNDKQISLVDKLQQKTDAIIGHPINRRTIKGLLSTLIDIDRNTGVWNAIDFKDFPEKAKSLLNEKIQEACNGWEFIGDGDDKQAKIEEFASYVIYMRLCMTFNQPTDSLRIGMLYLDKDKLEHEWLVFTGNKAALGKRKGYSVRNCGITEDCARAKERVNRWRGTTSPKPTFARSCGSISDDGRKIVTG